MKRAAALIAISMLGCGMDMTGRGGDDDLPGEPGEGSGPGTPVSGRISADTTWTDAIRVVGSVTIDPGVTLTVKPGTTVSVVPSKGYGITVSGTLDIQGTRDSKVVFRSESPGQFWSEVSVPRGGVMTASYLIQTGGAIFISGTGTVTLVDTQMSNVGGDFLVMSGGTLDMSYSAIGREVGESDSTHCDMHISGPVTVKVTHSSFSTSLYGLMFYGGSNVIFTHNNWFENDIDIDTLPAYPVNGDFSDSYFARGRPSNPGLTLNNLAAARLPDAGVR